MMTKKFITSKGSKRTLIILLGVLVAILLTLNSGVITISEVTAQGSFHGQLTITENSAVPQKLQDSDFSLNPFKLIPSIGK